MSQSKIQYLSNINVFLEDKAQIAVYVKITLLFYRIRNKDSLHNYEIHTAIVVF